MDDRKNQNREPEKGSGGGPKNRQTILIILICLLVSLMVMGLLNNALGGITSEDLDYSKFLDMVNNDEVQEVVLKSGTLTVTPKDQKSEGITYQVTMMGDEQELVDLLQEKGIKARVLDMSSIKPVDAEAIRKAAEETGRIITVEEHSQFGGLGAIVVETLSENPIPVRIIGIPDENVVHGNSHEIFAHYGLDKEGICKTALEFVKK